LIFKKRIEIIDGISANLAGYIHIVIVGVLAAGKYGFSIQLPVLGEFVINIGAQYIFRN
jgi:hypothetical protein